MRSCGSLLQMRISRSVGSFYMFQASHLDVCDIISRCAPTLALDLSRPDSPRMNKADKREFIMFEGRSCPPPS